MEQINKAINIINKYNKGDKSISQSSAIGYYLLAINLQKRNPKLKINVPKPK